jgi:hypothetical protein
MDAAIIIPDGLPTLWGRTHFGRNGAARKGWVDFMMEKSQKIIYERCWHWHWGDWLAHNAWISQIIMDL